eukprot:Tamp_10900.p4 GENE.Tamp_10900~~Tamp_10900.p4  ORF type:complete len:155 (+),score=25.05 Tamp_10900:1349-1813(+)
MPIHARTRTDAHLQEQKLAERRNGGGRRGAPAKPSGLDARPVKGAGGGGGDKGTNWKAKSDQFRAAMRNARKISEAQSKGIDVRTLTTLEETPEVDDRVLCQHCGRKFNAMAAERHIPKCASIINKPKPVGAGAAPRTAVPGRGTAQSTGARRR